MDKLEYFTDKYRKAVLQQVIFWKKAKRQVGNKKAHHTLPIEISHKLTSKE